MSEKSVKAEIGVEAPVGPVVMAEAQDAQVAAPKDPWEGWRRRVRVVINKCPGDRATFYLAMNMPNNARYTADIREGEEVLIPEVAFINCIQNLVETRYQQGIVESGSDGLNRTRRDRCRVSYTVLGVVEDCGVPMAASDKA